VHKDQNSRKEEEEEGSPGEKNKISMRTFLCSLKEQGRES
jgi:hypothetical protein